MGKGLRRVALGTAAVMLTLVARAGATPVSRAAKGRGPAYAGHCTMSSRLPFTVSARKVPACALTWNCQRTSSTPS